MERENKAWQIIRLQETASTNSYLKELLKEDALADRTVVATEFQSAGRGQQGNSWFGDKGKNLLFSILVYPKGLLAKEQFILSRIASLAVKKTFERYVEDVRIKWANDIYWQDKKLGGILIENYLQDNHIQSSIIGIGLNINQDDFPADLPNPVSLKQILYVDSDRNVVFDRILQEFFVLYDRLSQGETSPIEKEYMANLYRADGFYGFEDSAGRFQAEIVAVRPSGHLVLRTPDEKEDRVYAFKEVKFII
ncbi:MAG: biotin--[acetyl-CoA-carboxylase] ligase [Dysgonamonadaceae bacterium]|jgi:BirA family biotin operon repressor/biotin-[acetyl-CoA-carboxylase] ligase|nr:biotin--[acetyl-CoA-carboxylase] ligase [Dysgonamonadaceae bacterium]